MTSMTATRPTLPPIECTWWCEVGDGHPNESLPGDQVCRSGAYSQPLQTMPLADWGDHSEPSRLDLMAFRDPGEPAMVELSWDNLEGGSAAMTLDEAERFARKVLLTVSMARMEGTR